MYYGHLNHKKFASVLRDDQCPRHSGGEGMTLTIVFVAIFALFFFASVISYNVTKVPSPDGTHVHWTWFGKPMMTENGEYKSHHFMHPDKCAMCKQVIDEMNKDNEK